MSRLTDEERLLNAAAWTLPKKPGNTKKLGAQIELFLNEKQARLKKNAFVVDTWRQILPQEFQDHCSVIEISRGTLFLEAEPGPYMHEMKLMKTELLREIQNSCPAAGIRSINLRTARNNKTDTDKKK